MRHRLGLTTRTQISVCKSPFPSAGTAVSLFRAKTVQQRPLLPREVETWLPDCWVTILGTIIIVHNTVAQRQFLLIFPFLQTNITSQMWPSGGKGVWFLHQKHTDLDKTCYSGLGRQWKVQLRQLGTRCA